MNVWLVEGDASRRRELSNAFLDQGGAIALTGCFGSPGEAITALWEDATFDVALIYFSESSKCQVRTSSRPLVRCDPMRLSLPGPSAPMTPLSSVRCGLALWAIS